eukprot:682957-Amphidinium_carterae.1
MSDCIWKVWHGVIDRLRAKHDCPLAPCGVAAMRTIQQKYLKLFSGKSFGTYFPQVAGMSDRSQRLA